MFIVHPIKQDHGHDSAMAFYYTYMPIATPKSHLRRHAIGQRNNRSVVMNS